MMVSTNDHKAWKFLIQFHYWRETEALLDCNLRSEEGVLQKAVGLSVCQCQVFLGSQLKANSKDKKGDGYVAEKAPKGQRTYQ